MALYKVTETGAEKPRLIEAPSERAALNHATASRFKVETITSPLAAAELVGSGVKVEKARDAVPADTKEPAQNDGGKGAAGEGGDK